MGSGLSKPKSPSGSSSSCRECEICEVCPNTDVSNNYFNGWKYDTKVYEEIGVNNAEECFHLAKYNHTKNNNVIGYTYRKENHPTHPNTCVLFDHVGTGKIKEDDYHKSGCVNTSKNFEDGC